MKFELNSQQIEWLLTIVKFRLEDENSEMRELITCKREEAIAICQKRIDIWQSIYDELKKGNHVE